MSQATRALVLGVVLTVVAGCAGARSGQSDVVTLPGTGDSQDVLRALARGYLAQHSDRRVVVPDSIGSDGGIRVVGTGESPIGRVARRPSSEEQAQYGDFKYWEFAKVSVAFVVGKQAGVSDVREQQICDIFAGRLTSWKQVGGNDLPIEVQGRPEDGSNMKSIRKNMACFASMPVTPKAQFNLRNSDLVESMKKSPGAIGFMPLSEAKLHGFQVVTLDGVAAGTPSYKLGIALGFVYKKDLPPNIQEFIAYLKSVPAQEIMRKTGHVPVAG
jgi:phosphate transport system substrate-binding protein